MPTTYAHYRLGEKVRKQLPESVQKIIEENEELFHFGVHGPDHLFYYNPFRRTEVGEIGTKIHEEAGRKFFEKAAHILQECKDKDAHLSYIYGYLCHFAMDYVCHGYIGEQIEEKGLTHYEIEAEYDRRLLVNDGYDKPVEVCVTKHLKPAVKHAGIIADFYENVSVKQILRSLRGMKFYLNILRAPKKRMRRVVYLGMKLAGMYKTMRGLVMNYEEEVRCKETTDELVKRFETATELATRLITEYEMYLNQGDALSETFCYNFESGRCNEDE